MLIYQLLLYRHPLRGPRVHSPDPAEDDLIAFGPDGIFVDHPSDHSNRPVREEWAGFWPTRILGPQLVDMFGVDNWVKWEPRHDEMMWAHEMEWNE